MSIHLVFGGTATVLTECLHRIHPLGAIICVQAVRSAAFEVIVSLVKSVRMNPWVPVLVDREHVGSLQTILPVHIRALGWASTQIDSNQVDPAQWKLAESMCARELPKQDEFIDFLENRLGRHRADCVVRVLKTSGAEAAKRRALTESCLPPPHDWLDLWEMQPALSTAGREPGSNRRKSEAEVAWIFHTHPKTLSQRCHRLFGRRWPECIDLPWQARVEQFLRLRRLVTDPEVPHTDP